VRDRRIAGELLEALAKAFGAPITRDGVYLPAAQLATLLAFFDGSVHGELRDLQRERRSLRLWFKPAERRQLSERIHLRKQLTNIKLPPRHVALMDRTGVLVVPDLQAGGWQVHSIAALRPIGVTPVKGDVEAALRGDLGKQLATELAAHETRLAAAPLTAADVHHANATLWWLYNGKADTRFVRVVSGALQFT
jgi:hypothetical protein